MFFIPIEAMTYRRLLLIKLHSGFDLFRCTTKIVHLQQPKNEALAVQFSELLL